MSIKIKILLPMIFLTVITAAALLVSNILSFSQYVGTTYEERISSASDVASYGLEQLKFQAAAASLYISEDSGVIEALETGNREALLNRTIQLYNDTGIGFCTVSDSNGIAVARPHKPDSFGDDITAMPSVKSALSGRSMTTIEPGTSVLMSVCSGSPVYDGAGNLVGVVVVGFRLDTPDFVDSIKELTNCEVTVFLGDERISTTVTKEDGTRATGTKAALDVSRTVLAGNEYTGQAQILGQDALTSYVPISDANGKVQGMLFVGRYLAEKTNTIMSFIINGLIIVLILLSVAVPLILFISKQIVTPIRNMVEAAHALSTGDVDVNINVRTKDEMNELAAAFTEIIENTRKQSQIIETITDGDLTVSVEIRSYKDLMNNALNTMLERNNRVFSQVAYSAKEVASGSRQIADSSQSLALGSTQQTAAVEQLSGSIYEISKKTKENAGMTVHASELAETIRQSAEKGSNQMNQMVDAVREIQEASNSISKVIKVIDDIAFQTNILALNAAVEAARAGQHGKGFAVVADEVRSLSAKSAAAAKDTGRLIADAMEKAELGTRIADETAVSLAEIVVGINKSGSIVGDIAKSSEEQAAAIEQINRSIEQVTSVVQQNTAAAQEAASASEEMSEQANILENLVARFKTKNQ